MPSLSFSAVLDQSLPVFVTAESDAGFAWEIKLSFKFFLFFILFSLDAGTTDEWYFHSKDLSDPAAAQG